MRCTCLRLKPSALWRRATPSAWVPHPDTPAQVEEAA
jgi:hypothetical protein